MSGIDSTTNHIGEHAVTNSILSPIQHNINPELITARTETMYVNIFIIFS